MAVWQSLSALRGNAQARTKAQMRKVPDEAACKAGGALVPDFDIHRSLAVRSPEQTALIALRGLLDAKEMYIQKLEAEAKATDVRNEHRMNALRRACHAKIQGVQKSSAVQLQSLKHSYEERLEETAGKMQVLRQELTAADSHASTLATSLHAAEASCMKAQEHAVQLRQQLQSANSAAESAQSKAQQLEAETIHSRKAIKEESSTSRAAITELEARITDMASKSAAQQEEIAALSATIQVQCLQRIELHRQMKEAHNTMPQSSAIAATDRHPSVAARAHEPAGTGQSINGANCGMQIYSQQAAILPIVIQRRGSTVRGGLYAELRPGQSRQWQRPQEEGYQGGLTKHSASTADAS